VLRVVKHDGCRADVVDGCCATFIGDAGALCDDIQSFCCLYERSHTFWSPDGRSLVSTGLPQNPGEGESDPIATVRSEVWVVSADGSTLARSLGQCGLALWTQLIEGEFTHAFGIPEHSVSTQQS
jgi:hypothetical protein